MVNTASHGQARVIPLHFWGESPNGSPYAIDDLDGPNLLNTLRKMLFCATHLVQLYLDSYRLPFELERIGILSLFILTLAFFIATAGDQALLFIVISASPIFFFAYGWMRNLWKGSSATA